MQLGTNMAGNKINTKSKGRDDKSKGNKCGSQNNEESDDHHDFSMLRKPILTSITGFAQARKIFDLGTIELKQLITNECDLLYECKVCRNIFRSLINFISHKRVYCKEQFNTSQHGHFLAHSSMVNEFLKLKRLEEEYNESLKAKVESEQDLEDEGRIPLTKDLTAVVENITKTRGVREGVIDEVQQVTLRKISSSPYAVFQSAGGNEEIRADHMRQQVQELDQLLSQDKAVLQSDGKFKIESSKPDNQQESEGVIQISDDEENDTEEGSLTCKICNLRFSTQKTMKFHMKYKHLASRLVFPCPDCVDIFSTSWSVYRHLFKVHRKSAAQIRRLRESIQAKAFKMNNPPPSYERRKNNMKPATEVKKISEEERLDQENQAWMDNMESDGSMPRCGGCGRSFERRAALASHTHTCQPRHRALRRATDRDPRRIEIQIRKDYNKGPSGVTVKSNDGNANKAPQDEIKKSVFKIQKEPEKKVVLEEATMFVDDEEATPPEDNKDNDENSTEPPEKPADEPAKEKPTIKVENEEEKDDLPIDPPIPKQAFSEQSEKLVSNLVAFKQKLQQNKSDVDIPNLHCNICNWNAKNIYELYDHLAQHYKWVRYTCKLCNFKNYEFEKLSEHVKTVHKLRGDNEFYCSTIKALDGAEALEHYNANNSEEAMDETESSPNSRRPSRCSSDSSRFSDDSSNSSARFETATRKRKMNTAKTSGKKKKRQTDNDKDEKDAVKTDGVTIDKVIHHVIFGDADTNAQVKSFEENSSDLDDTEDKIVKRMSTPAVATRRPVRKKTIRKNEDFEYDLSNLLKMEAQGYRESQNVVTTKTTQTKKKPASENQTNQPSLNDTISNDFIGALLAMSKKSVDLSAALIKPYDMSVFKAVKEPIRASYPFVKPMLPKLQGRSDKVSPKKDLTDEKDINKTATKSTNINSINETTDPPLTNNEIKANVKEMTPEVKPTAGNIIPIKLRRQSMEVIKNPIINKNISELSKAGMKTKILVIKPINRNKDGSPSVGKPIKFQTIKLKDPKRASKDSNSDQVVVVKMPKVDRAAVATNSNKELRVTENNTTITPIDSATAKSPDIKSDDNEAKKSLSNDDDVTSVSPKDNNIQTNNEECEIVNHDSRTGTE
ncbi:hypothetical protein JYU34_006811 [Plutella xylostella]|uniref:C2H2-type domain-containing protein n=2 Tax=Plutella xylostella TaxID=51655 RepID=A0ABQ7QSW8_PLUXY|nr:hypothetical protein JYU34_006811 [Plutella xylostella]